MERERKRRIESVCAFVFVRVHDLPGCLCIGQTFWQIMHAHKHKRTHGLGVFRGYLERGDELLFSQLIYRGFGLLRDVEKHAARDAFNAPSGAAVSIIP